MVMHTEFGKGYWLFDHGQYTIVRVNNETYVFVVVNGSEYKVKSWKSEIHRLSNGRVNYV